MDLILGILIALGAVYLSKILNKPKSNEQGSSTPPVLEEGKQEQIDYSKAYQPKYLLTRNEWHEYKKLKDLAAGKGLQICPKVRLLDIVEPRKDQKNYKSLFYKVQAKHVDFVITDQDLRIKAIVELDDDSHNTKARQERDQFVDQILTACGYKVIRARSITDQTLSDL